MLVCTKQQSLKMHQAKADKAERERDKSSFIVGDYSPPLRN